MFADEFPGAIRTRLTTQHLRAIDTSYRQMPAFFDDIRWTRFRNHAPEYNKDETLSPHDEAPCTILSMNAKMGSFPDEIRETLPANLQRSLASERRRDQPHRDFQPALLHRALDRQSTGRPRACIPPFVLWRVGALLPVLS